MNTSKTSDIFDYLKTKDIPPVISIPFCLRLLGIKTNDLYKSMGVSRSLLYQVLAGNRKPNERIKQKLDELGINPWNNNKSYRDRSDPHRPPLPHHAAYGSVLRDSADQAESDPGEHKTK